MPDWLGWRGQRSPDALALRSRAGDLSYGALDALAARAAGTLRAMGVRKGDRIAALGLDGVPFAVLLHGVLRLGAVLVPVHGRLAPPETAFVLRDAAPSVLVLGEGIPPETVAELAPDLPLRFAPDLAAGPPVAPLRHRLSDLAVILYTSGTTGRPKGAMLTFGNFYHSAVTAALRLGIHPQDRWLLCMPLFHVGGLSILLRAVVYGISVVIQEGFSETAVERALREEGVTMVSLVPLMLRRLLARGVPFPPSVRFVLLGGGPAPPSLLREALAAGIPVAPTYGLTETASQVATLPPWEAAKRIGSVGRPLFLTEVRIVRGGEEAGPGQVGEILVRGPTVSPGYWGGTPATGGGYLYTGDLGRLDAEGYLFVLDRRLDLIVTGGENVYPAEVEAALLEHPLVREAGVYAAPDPAFGQAVRAAVVLRAGARVSEADLRSFLRGRLAGYKIPRRIRFCDRLPRNAGGKLMRRRLREEAEEG